jgi:hypothetical protein
MATKTITVPDPAAANAPRQEIRFSFTRDGTGAVVLGIEGFVMIYSGGDDSIASVQDSAHPTDLTGAQLTAIRNAMAPVFSLAATRQGF